MTNPYEAEIDGRLYVHSTLHKIYIYIEFYENEEPSIHFSSYLLLPFSLPFVCSPCCSLVLSLLSPSFLLFIRFLGTAGQNVDNIERYLVTDDKMHLAEKVVRACVGVFLFARVRVCTRVFVCARSRACACVYVGGCLCMGAYALCVKCELSVFLYLRLRECMFCMYSAFMTNVNSHFAHRR